MSPVRLSPVSGGTTYITLVTNEDDTVVPNQLAQAKVTPPVPNASIKASVEKEGSSEPLASLVTWQEGDMTSRV